MVISQAKNTIDASVTSREKIPLQYVGLLWCSGKLGAKVCSQHNQDNRRILFGEPALKPWNEYLSGCGNTDNGLPLYLAHEMDVSVVGLIPTAYEFWVIHFIKEAALKVQGKISEPEFRQAHHRPKVSLYHLFLELMDFVKLRE